MKKRKYALKYFIHLIKFGGLTKQLYDFHLHCADRIDVDRGAKYDEETETLVYDDGSLDYGLVRVVFNFRQHINTEVARKRKKAKSIIYDQLTSGTVAERKAFYCQVMRDLKEMADIIAGHPIFPKYLGVVAALRDIKSFVASHQPLIPEQTDVNVSEPIVEQVVGFHYRCFEKGGFEENKSLARYRLGNLFSALKDKLEFIAPGTSLDDFRAVFSGKIIVKPIVWLGVISQLNLFIKVISPKLISPGQQKLDEKWVTTAACFVNRKGGMFTPKQVGNPGSKRDEVHRGHEIGELVELL